MTNAQEFPQEAFDRVHQLVNLTKESIEDGPRNREWLLDFNLPGLYVAIGGLYTALGESERLEQAQASTTQQ